jgi:16S rRNA processing protein RimM
LAPGEEGQAGLAASEPRFLIIGKVERPHGVRGEVRVSILTDLPERFTWLKRVFVGDRTLREYGVEAARLHGGTVLLKLTGIDDRNAAESLRSMLLQVPAEESIPLEEGEYFLYQLVGLEVVSETGEVIGELQEVIETGANYVFLVRGPLGEVLLPDTKEVVRQIDFEQRRMTVHLLPGLLA